MLFRKGTYDVLRHNCSTFVDDILQLLTENRLPDDIFYLPHDVINSALTGALRPLLENRMAFAYSGCGTLPWGVSEVRLKCSDCGVSLLV